jgi:quercetin dioxygenase-like cupin family protein
MYTNKFKDGKILINGQTIEIEKLEWNEHPTFKGVSLKHLIKGESTNNQLSCHLVKVEPGCEIGLHNHVGKTELHEVLNGSGVCTVENTDLNYEEGIIGFIPADKNHLVKAGKDGLFLMAKFFPSLL